MKGGEIFIEVNGKEVNACRSTPQCLLVMLNGAVIVLNGLGSQRPGLSITTSVARDEQHRNTFNLFVRVSVSFLSCLGEEELLSGPRRSQPPDTNAESIWMQSVCAPCRNRQS